MLENNEWLNVHEWRILAWLALQITWLTWPVIGAVACVGLVLIPLWFAGRIEVDYG